MNSTSNTTLLEHAEEDRQVKHKAPPFLHSNDLVIACLYFTTMENKSRTSFADDPTTAMPPRMNLQTKEYTGWACRYHEVEVPIPKRK